MKNSAKYGDKPCDAGTLAMFVLSQTDPKNVAALNNLNADATASSSAKVNGAEALSDNLTDDQKKVNEARQFAKERKERKERKKNRR